MQTVRPASGFPTVLTFSDEFNAAAERSWRNREIFQHLSSLRKQSVAVENLSVRLLQAVVEMPVHVAEKTPIDLIGSIVIERIAQRVASLLAFQVLRQQPSVVFQCGLRVGINRRDGVIRRNALLWKYWEMREKKICKLSTITTSRPRLTKSFIHHHPKSHPSKRN